MCGRAACGLNPDAICDACGHQTKDGQWTKPKWRDAPGGQKFQPSYNMCPTSYAPVLVSKKHFKDPDTSSKAETTEFPAETDITDTVQCLWVIQPMRWGLIPSWHTGDPKSVGYQMINARSDGILSKRTFKGPLEKGRRCVVLVEGYYEWHTNKDGKKQPYFIYFPEATSSNISAVNQELLTQNVTEGAWTGKRLLTLAGIFDICQQKEMERTPSSECIPCLKDVEKKVGNARDNNGKFVSCKGDAIYSFAIVTVDSHESMSWLHDRMPAVLNGEQEVSAWLNFGDIPLSEAVKMIKPVDSVSCHPVSSAVGDVKNKSEECVKPIDLEKKHKKETAGSTFMKNWLKTGQKRSASTSTDSKEEGATEDSKTETKKPKSELNVDESQSGVKEEVKTEVECKNPEPSEDSANEAPAAKEDVRDMEALTCSVCLDLFFQPHGCEPCRHVFCDPCLRRLKSSTPLETRCPICRTVIIKCLPRNDLGDTIRSAFPQQYNTRHDQEKRQHRRLPSLPSTASRSLRAFLRHRRHGNNDNNNNNNNTLTVIAQFAFFVLLVMFAFTIFATTVGYLLWYLLELSMDIALDLIAAVNNFWDSLYQAMIVWSVNGHIPPRLKEMLSGSVSDMSSTYNKFSGRMQELWNGGDQYRHQFMGHLRYHMTNGTNELLSKVKEAQVANYILLAFLSTILLYKLARYVQRLQERLQEQL